MGLPWDMENPINQLVCWYEMFPTMLGCQPEGLKLIRMDELRISQNHFPTIANMIEACDILER